MPSKKAPGAAGALARKYGRAKTIEELLNRAIRAEVAGGNELLDAIECSHKLVSALQGPIHQHAQDLHYLLLSSRDKIRVAIRDRYERESQ